MTASVKDKKIDFLQSLLDKNKVFSEQFKKSPLLKLISSQIFHDRNIRNRLLDSIQVLSNYFQKVVMMRHVFCEDEKFLKITTMHLLEEFSHDTQLNNDRNNRPLIWDPVLDSGGCWFAWKMFTLDNQEKTVLVHLVLETSGNIFFQEAHKYLTRYGETKYFETHAKADEEHEKMGLDAIKSIDEEKAQRLFLVQQQGWEIMNIVCNQIKKIVFSPDNR